MEAKETQVTQVNRAFVSCDWISFFVYNSSPLNMLLREKKSGSLL